jgi:hypothetical protein
MATGRRKLSNTRRIALQGSAVLVWRGGNGPHTPIARPLICLVCGADLTTVKHFFFLFIYDLCRGAGGANRTMPKDLAWLMHTNFQICGSKQSRHNLRYCPVILLKRLRSSVSLRGENPGPHNKKQKCYHNHHNVLLWHVLKTGNISGINIP